MRMTTFERVMAEKRFDIAGTMRTGNQSPIHRSVCPRAGRKAVGSRALGGPVMDFRSFSASRGEPVCRVGVTPSDACGLGRASSSAKGWVLAMLARKGELRRGSGPAPKRAFLSGRLCPAPGNRTRGGGRRHNAGGTSRAERKDRDHDPEIHPDNREDHGSPHPARCASPSPSNWSPASPLIRAWSTTSSAPSASNPSITTASATRPRNTSPRAPRHSGRR